MHTTEISVEVLSGGQSSSIAISATSAQSPVVALPTNHPPGVPVKILFTPSVSCFGRKGSNPTALADGTDQTFLAGNTYRTELLVGDRMAFITSSGSGTVAWTPAA